MFLLSSVNSFLLFFPRILGYFCVAIFRRTFGSKSIIAHWYGSASLFFPNRPGVDDWFCLQTFCASHSLES